MKGFKVLRNLAAFCVFTQVVLGEGFLPKDLAAGPSKVIQDLNGDSTTTLYLKATRNGRHPIGILTSTVDKFINGGTTTEYMTQHEGSYIDNTYAKVEKTSTREYYYIPEPTQILSTPVKPTGLIAASTSYQVNDQLTTEHTIQQYRTYVDGKYAHLVSTVANVYSDQPSAAVSATPIYRPEYSERRQPKGYTFPGEYIKPSKSYKKSGLVTRTIGSKTYKLPKFSRALKLDDLIEAESRRSHKNEDHLNLIRARSIKAGTDEVKVEEEEEEKDLHKDVVPTFTVNEDGVLHIPEPSVDLASLENEIEPTLPHRFDRPIKPTKTMLDSVTYVGFVDFTTTIDDTVVIFRPKKTYSTATRNILIPKIQPTSVVEQQHRFKPSSILGADAMPKPVPEVDPSLPETHRTSKPDKATPSPVSKSSSSVSIPRHTSGINPLKSLLQKGASSRRSKLPFGKSSISRSISSSSSSTLNNRPIITLSPKLTPEPPTEPPTTEPFIESSTERRPIGAPEPTELTSSIDTDSDVELVYKTLYTTYTYFTTFFRASTTRVKSRAEVISNVITLTNILSPSDLASLRSSCEVDQTCQFASSSVSASSDFTNGFIGRPTTRLVEEPRSSGQEEKDEVKEEVKEEVKKEEEGGLNAILKTFYTTYTYFTTLSVDGTSSISTRTEVYSNIKSKGVPVSTLDSNSFSIRPTSTKQLKEIEPSSVVPSARGLQYSSISRDTTTTESSEAEEVTTEKSEPGTTTAAEVEVEVVATTESLPQETTTLSITPTPILREEETTTTEDNSDEDEKDNEEEVEVDPSSVIKPMKTFYTTYTYFTTLFRNGTSYVTSNLETVTNTADATVTPSLVQPSVTFFTTFTYWTTSIDGDKTIITSQEETKTDILPASLTEQISLLPTSLTSIQVTSQESNEIVPTSTQAFNLAASIAPTEVPDLESGEADLSSTVGLELASASITPSLASSSLSLEELDNDFTLASSINPASESPIKASDASPSSRSRLTFTRPSRTFTPVIRPSLLLRARPRPNIRSRGRSRTTTVAIVTRSDVTPTLIATPASSPLPQSSPSFGGSSVSSASAFNNKARSSSRASINPSRSSALIRPSPASKAAEEDVLKPSIRSGLSLRRPNPFRARLKERQRQRLQQLRSKSKNDDNEEITTKASPPSEPITPPRFPVGVPGRTPIFVSSRTENINRKPKEVDRRVPPSSPDISKASDDNIRLPTNIQNLRERARARIQSLFRRRRPDFTRPRPNLESSGAEPLSVQESRRRKRQFSRQQQERKFHVRQ